MNIRYYIPLPVKMLEFVHLLSVYLIIFVLCTYTTLIYYVCIL